MVSLKRAILWFALGSGLVLPSAFAAEPTNRPLEIAILPYLSTRAVLTTYAPLQKYMELALHRPVLLVTAPDMKTFVKRTQREEYSYVITAPHFARFAQLEAGYVPFICVDQKLHGTLVVDKDSDVHAISDLRGRVVATPDSIAIISMLGVELLRRHGLQPGRDVVIKTTASHNSAVLSVQRGEAAAAFTAANALKQMPENLRNSVRPLATTTEVPSLVYMANRHVPASEVDMMAKLLLEFAVNSPEGKTFQSNTGLAGFRRPSTQELRSLDPFVQDLKKIIGSK